MVIRIFKFSKHLLVVVFHTTLFITMTVIQNNQFRKYNTPELTLINNNMLELATIIVYLFIFRSRKLPEYSNMDYLNEDVNDMGNVYACNLSKKGGYGFDSNLKKFYSKNKATPLIVINPTFNNNHNINGNDSNEYLNRLMHDKLSIGFTSV